MVESQNLINHKIEGRIRDLAALARIQNMIEAELVALQLIQDDPDRINPEYKLLTSEDLMKYSHDLVYRLSHFLNEGNDLRLEIKKISKIQH
jgi:hypothetical protein